jgi:hypothetical protein
MGNECLGGNFTFEPTAQHPSAPRSSEIADRTAIKSTLFRSMVASLGSAGILSAFFLVSSYCRGAHQRAQSRQHATQVHSARYFDNDVLDAQDCLAMLVIAVTGLLVCTVSEFIHSSERNLFSVYGPTVLGFNGHNLAVGEFFLDDAVEKVGLTMLPLGVSHVADRAL